MQDDLLSQPPRAVSRARSNGRYLAVALIAAVVFGAGAALWGGRAAGLIDFEPDRAAAARPAGSGAAIAGSTPVEGAQAALGVRLAELEQRMTQLNLQAEAASGNAARAEGLLVAFAARRAVERGEPLGYLKTQLKLRFGDAQPNAVATLLDTGDKPVTLDVLQQGLNALAPALARAPSSADAWTRVRNELSNLFVLRKVSAPSPAPERRLDRARTFLETGQVEAAIGEVERMPGRAAARDWLDLARRYARTQRALDQIETAALLEPRELNDGAGQPIATPSPMAAPVGEAGSF